MTELTWTNWVPIHEISGIAPRTSGVYEVRDEHGVVYVGRAGDRRNGVAARLGAYAVGKSPDSGLAGHASRRALADPVFCQRITDAAQDNTPWTVSRIAIESYAHLRLTARAAASADSTATELRLLGSHDPELLWNVR